MTTIRDIIATDDGWWVAPGTCDEDRTLTWLLLDGIGQTLGEFPSKMVADHVAKIHNAKVINARRRRPVSPCTGRRLC